jgi:hypothetical protein
LFGEIDGTARVVDAQSEGGGVAWFFSAVETCVDLVGVS